MDLTLNILILIIIISLQRVVFTPKSTASNGGSGAWGIKMIFLDNKFCRYFVQSHRGVQRLWFVSRILPLDTISVRV
ncbi:hypothetical protein GGI43DRAFT_413724 [Trichoderma evansii]